MYPWKNILAMAHHHAQSADFHSMRALCEQVALNYRDHVLALLDVGVLWFNFGFISDATQCFERVTQLDPHDSRAWLNLANCFKEQGDYKRANGLYLSLQTAHPDHVVIRRNVLTSLEYSPEASDSERFSHAQAWGAWATARAGGPQPRPLARLMRNSQSHAKTKLKVGYVSADFCQHTVGLFVKDVLQTHQRHAQVHEHPHPVEVFAYYSGQVNDWVTQALRQCCTWRDVSALDDTALAKQIREDQIDVLIDLSGHTAGSRLTVFAHRPAPVQLSWLGYFATTGLDAIDAVLLDAPHAPEGTEHQFVEEVVRLEGGRFYYQPVPWAPEVAEPPCLRSGHITFGSFNNTGKLNLKVYDVWAQVLRAVPNATLVLKWRTLVDAPLCQAIRQAFEDRGVSASRIELRPASFHIDMLKEYADIDIALDPFPFTGGLTSCEALWMGVPVVTLPQSRVVSRQTFALLSAIGQTQWVAPTEHDYVRIAQSLASDPNALAHVRQTLRHTMRQSALMDLTGFTQKLEQVIYQLHDKYAPVSSLASARQ